MTLKTPCNIRPVRASDFDQWHALWRAGLNYCHTTLPDLVYGAATAASAQITCWLTAQSNGFGRMVHGGITTRTPFIKTTRPA